MISLMWSWSMWLGCKGLYFSLEFSQLVLDRTSCWVPQAVEDTQYYIQEQYKSLTVPTPRQVLTREYLSQFTVFLKLYPRSFHIQQTAIMTTCRHHVSSLPFFILPNRPGRDIQTRWACCTSSFNRIQKSCDPFTSCALCKKWEQEDKEMSNEDTQQVDFFSWGCIDIFGVSKQRGAVNSQLCSAFLKVQNCWFWNGIVQW